MFFKKLLSFLPEILIFLFFTIYISWDLGKLGFWGDETFSGLLAQKTIPEIISISVKDTNPPLYPILQHLWGKAFGYGVFSLRFFSAFCYGLLASLVFYLCRKIWKQPRVLAILTTAAVCFNPTVTYYGQENRNYVLLMLLVFAVLVRFEALHKKLLKTTIEPKSKPEFWNYAYVSFLTLLMLYTQSIAVFIVFIMAISELIWIFANRTSFDVKKHFFNLFFWGCFVSAAFLPWFFILIRQSNKVDESFWLGFDPITSLTGTLQDVFLGLGYDKSWGVFWESLLLCGVIFLIGLWIISLIQSASFLISLLFSNSKKTNKQTDRESYLKNIEPDSFVALIGFGCLLAIYLVSFKTPLLYIRYVSFIVPLVIINIYNHLFTKLSPVLWPRQSSKNLELKEENIYISENFKKDQQSKLIQINQFFVFTILIGLPLFSVLWYRLNVMQNPNLKTSEESSITYLQKNLQKDDLIVNPSMSGFTSTRYYLGYLQVENAKNYLWDPDQNEPFFTGTAILEPGDYWDQDLSKTNTVWVILEGKSPEFETLLTQQNFVKTEDKQPEKNRTIQKWQKKE